MSLYITSICDFRNILRILKNISSDSLFIFDKDQLILQSSDIFNNIFVTVNIKKKYFKFYKETTNINVNVINLYKILLISNRFSDVSFEIIKNNMNINIIDKPIEKRILFPLNSKNIDKKDIYKIYKYKFDLPCKDLYENLKKCNEINNIVTINFQKNKIFLISNGDYASLVVEQDVCLDEDINISLNFNIKKLLNICKLYKLYKNSVIEIMEDSPLKIYFTEKDTDIEITFFLVNEI
jgi:hypothetical protein